MGRSNAPNGGVVFEALANDNYDHWSILAKNYLISKDLWVDIIEDSKQSSESRTTTTHGKARSSSESKKKDANALDFIRRSCGSEALSHIKGITTAQSAWNTLASLYGSRLRNKKKRKKNGSRLRKANPDIEQGFGLEKLTDNNYDQWSILAKNYLMREDLWVDIIEDGKQIPKKVSESSRTSLPPQGTESKLEWKKRNAKALHFIQMSCGSETLSQIKETRTAKNAWNSLASLYRSKLRANPDIEQGLTSLHRGVQRGDWDSARIFVDNNRRAIYETSNSGKTALHIAVLSGHDDMVKKLANKVPTWLLEERDAKGCTALALAAALTDDTSMARCMVERSETLLTIKDNEGLIPVVLAAVKGHKNMTDYLYKKTPKHVLNEDNGRTSALLLTRCITSQMFDVALDLLQRNPKLPLALQFEGVSPIYALAQQPSAFPSVNPPTFFQRCLYSCITHDEYGRAINITLRRKRGERRKYIITFAGLRSHLLGFLPTVFLQLRVDRKNMNKKDMIERWNEGEKGFLSNHLGNLFILVRGVFLRLLGRQSHFGEFILIVALTVYPRRLGPFLSHLCGILFSPIRKCCLPLLGHMSHVLGYFFSTAHNVFLLLYGLLFHLLGLLLSHVRSRVFLRLLGLLFHPLRFVFTLLRRIFTRVHGILSNVLGFFLNPVRRVFLRLPGIRKIYKKKRTHFLAVEILKCMAKGIMGFNESELQEASVYESMLEASKSGIAEFIILMTEADPDLYWVIDENQRGIFSYAILNRREQIFNLIYDLKGQGKVIISRTDIFGNNMSHLTGMLAPLAELDRKSGPALQMQRELQWFKAVKRILHPKFQQTKNGDGLKPRQLFTKKHEELVKEGEKWAKETASSFALVGTLIITIMFAAAFTVPGGNDQNTGFPMFVHKRMFTVFTVADVISLFASSTSVMTFIGILTSRYAEKDFLRSLPIKLTFGLFTLIFSIICMMAAFCSALSLMQEHGHFNMIFAFSIAGLSVLILLFFQLPLLFEIFQSTFRSEILVKNKKL